MKCLTLPLYSLSVKQYHFRLAQLETEQAPELELLEGHFSIKQLLFLFLLD